MIINKRDCVKKKKKKAWFFLFFLHHFQLFFFFFSLMDMLIHERNQQKGTSMKSSVLGQTITVHVTDFLP